MTLPAVPDLDGFLSACSARMGKDRVCDGDVQEDLMGQRRHVAAVIRPRSTDDVMIVVKLANVHGVSLYPVSRGLNWGMGSDLPVAEGSVRVELSDMDTIREMDLTLGTATVEAGVTQKMLADRLEGSPFFVDVTGSGASTSLVGNALERGVGYIGTRESQVTNLEVVLGCGRIVRSGRAHIACAHRPNSYRHGLGPDIDGLFFQSNMGIVTAATFDLQPLPSAQVNFSLSLREDVALKEMIDTLRQLLLNRVLLSVPHVFERNRIMSLAAPKLLLKLREKGHSPSATAVEAYLERIIRGQWFVGGTLLGERAVVHGAKRVLRERLGRLGKLRFYGAGENRWMPRLLNVIGMNWSVALIEAMAPLTGLNRGRPTDETLSSIYWPSMREEADLTSLDPDRSAAGLRTCTMLCPMVGADAERLVGIVREVCEGAALPYAISLNGMTPRALEAVINIYFRRDDARQAVAAQVCHEEMLARLMKAGFAPHRATIDTMTTAIGGPDSFWETVGDVKRVLDPGNVISPGRYDPSFFSR